jgi:methylated-DNA-protein-cysteine methyltransferase related protein
MVAGIVPITMNQFPSLGVLSFDKKEMISMPPKRSSTEKLKAVHPSGKRDESFFEMVFHVVRQVPKGRVTSYGAIAAAIGARSSSRMVGWAMNGSHKVRPKVPAHRVVNRNGQLTGKAHFEYPEQMQELLEKEGVLVKDDKVFQFREKFWDPSEATI